MFLLRVPNGRHMWSSYLKPCMSHFLAGLSPLQSTFPRAFLSYHSSEFDAWKVVWLWLFIYKSRRVFHIFAALLVVPYRKLTPNNNILWSEQYYFRLRMRIKCFQQSMQYSNFKGRNQFFKMKLNLASLGLWPNQQSQREVNLCTSQRKLQQLLGRPSDLLNDFGGVNISSTDINAGVGMHSCKHKV